MKEREFESELERLMKRDRSERVDEFRDALLQRCLNVLDTEARGISLSDADLDLLAAAGDPAMHCQSAIDMRRPFDSTQD